MSGLSNKFGVWSSEFGVRDLDIELKMAKPAKKRIEDGSEMIPPWPLSIL